MIEKCPKNQQLSILCKIGKIEKNVLNLSPRSSIQKSKNEMKRPKVYQN